jgi:hypothetical protein
MPVPQLLQLLPIFFFNADGNLQNGAKEGIQADQSA